MIDNFSILLSHALLLIAFWYLTLRNDLDHEDPPVPDADSEGFRIKPRPGAKRNPDPQTTDTP